MKHKELENIKKSVINNSNDNSNVNYNKTKELEEQKQNYNTFKSKNPFYALNIDDSDDE